MELGKKATLEVMLTLLLLSTLVSAFNIQTAKAENDIYEFLAAREGFGRNATGGLGGDFYYVTTLADSGSGSLRAAAESDDPLWVVFNVSGSIHLNNEIIFKANKTIDGRGANVTITGYGFKIQDPDVSNVIVTHLAFNTGNKDAIRTNNGAHDLWIHHCDFANWGDGCVDITEEATDVTVSWCRFWNHDKVMLIGSNPEDTGDVVIRVTLHHNFFNGTNQRHPRLRFGKVDAYNNYFYKWGSYGMGVAMNGSLLVEANIFEAGLDKDAVITSVGSDPYRGYARLVDNLLLNGAVAHENEPGQVFNRSTYYTATIETADNILKWKIMSRAGAETHITTPRPPEASFAYTPSYPIINQTVTFNASASLPGWNGTHSVPIANYTWDFGDGNVTTVAHPIVNHTYTAVGNYAVNLTVTCEDDPVLIAEQLTSDTTSKTIIVHPDTAAPTVSVMSPENKTYSVNDVPLTFTVNETTSWMGYSLDGQMNLTITGNTTLLDLAEGSHSLIVYANDTSGNIGVSTEVFFTIAPLQVITATVKIHPETLNLKSKGKWITCYIKLPEGYNVSDIDVSTILLNNTIPAEWSDVQDGILMVKFSRADVIFLLDVDIQTIRITGELTDGTTFEGIDTIRAINGRQKG